MRPLQRRGSARRSRRADGRSQWRLHVPCSAPLARRRGSLNLQIRGQGPLFIQVDLPVSSSTIFSTPILPDIGATLETTEIAQDAMPSQKFMHRARITRMPRGASVSEPGHIDRVPYRRFGNVYL